MILGDGAKAEGLLALLLSFLVLPLLVVVVVVLLLRVMMVILKLTGVKTPSSRR